MTGSHDYLLVAPSAANANVSSGRQPLVQSVITLTALAAHLGGAGLRLCHHRWPRRATRWQRPARLALPPTAPYEPGAHLMHANSEEAPSVGACVPGGHGVGVTVPSAQKWPRGHEPEHVALVSEVVSP